MLAARWVAQKACPLAGRTAASSGFLWVEWTAARKGCGPVAQLAESMVCRRADWWVEWDCWWADRMASWRGAKRAGWWDSSGCWWAGTTESWRDARTAGQWGWWAYWMADRWEWWVWTLADGKVY